MEFVVSLSSWSELEYVQDRKIARVFSINGSPSNDSFQPHCCTYPANDSSIGSTDLSYCFAAAGYITIRLTTTYMYIKKQHLRPSLLDQEAYLSLIIWLILKCLPWRGNIQTKMQEFVISMTSFVEFLCCGTRSSNEHTSSFGIYWLFVERSIKITILVMNFGLVWYPRLSLCLMSDCLAWKGRFACCCC